MHYFPLAFLCFCLLGPGTKATGKGYLPDHTEWQCPSPEAIWPCRCSVDSRNNMDMDCSAVSSEEQLAAVFRTYFPNPNFRKFILYKNDRVKTLQAGALGNTTYQQIWITEGALETIEEGALFGSFHTAFYLVLNFNRISDFPFSDLPSFSGLVSLDLRHNHLVGFPKLASSTLQALYLSYNALECLPVGAFRNTPALKDLQLTSTEIAWIPPGIFSGLQHLKNVALGKNHLTYLDDGALECGPNMGMVDLGYNEIRHMAPKAFKGQSRSWIYLHQNHLTSLEEKVWRDLFEKAGVLDPVGDPLHCGCDVAWILRRPAFQRAVDKYTTCADGKLLRNLNPQDYDYC
ncbi:oplophorus-luciferin 2-monooxygenase non-catalytic subunit-like [Panulirus ornatus]|uniref:oplophorus-luciferin 2-monooxygenase non-catalytic subunit-like n=1 Tax=Panulirus ornatus TaxID=150431 RepID=UPI003A8B33D2